MSASSSRPTSDRRAVAAGLFALLVSACAWPLAPTRWLAAETEKFRLFTTADADEARRLAEELEVFRAAVGRFTGVDTDRRAPLTVVLLRSRVELNPYRPVANVRPSPVAEFFAHGSWRQVIGLGVERRTEARQMVFHEATHWLIHQPDQPLPLWLAEGAAEVLSTFAVEGGAIRLGAAPLVHQRLLRRTDLWPTAELVALERGTLSRRPVEVAHRFYAQAWLTTHFLSEGASPAGVARIRGFIRALRLGRPQPEAFEEAFGLSYAQADQALQRYRRQHLSRWAATRVEAIGAPPAVRIGPADPHDVLLATGELALGGERYDTAERLLHEAVQQAPAEPRGHELLGAVYYEQGRPAAARATFAQAIELGATRPETRLALGALWIQDLADAPTAAPRRERIRQAADLFHGVIASHPDRVEAYHALAALSPALSPLEARDAVALEQGHRRAPEDHRILLGLAFAALRRGQPEAAGTLLDRVLHGPVASGLGRIPAPQGYHPDRHHDGGRQRQRERTQATVRSAAPPAPDTSERTRELWQLALGLQRVELALASARSGDAARARRLLAQLQANPRQPAEVRQRARDVLRSLGAA